MNEYRVKLPNGFETTLLLDEEHKERDYPDAVPVDGDAEGDPAVDGDAEEKPKTRRTVKKE